MCLSVRNFVATDSTIPGVIYVTFSIYCQPYAYVKNIQLYLYIQSNSDLQCEREG